MMEALNCPECGTALDTEALNGLCPACLLAEGMKDSASMATPDSQATSPYGAAFIPPLATQLEPRFPQLEILALLGQGGMGAVYKARQRRLDRFVALKILPPEAGRDSNFADRFEREARALAKLSHPHIVGIHDFGEHEGLFYFLMDYVDGPTLRRLLASGPLSPSLAMEILGQVCDALQYAHEEGVIHRDIKPENILLDSKGRVKIADFGLAKLIGLAPAELRLTASRQAMGTPHYMAPEQLEKPLEVDHRADIYSLGVTFYEMLTGGLPLGRFPLPSQKAGVDPRLDEVVLRALEKDPNKRYQRVSELNLATASLVREPPTKAAEVSMSVIRIPEPEASEPISAAFTMKWSLCSARGFIRLVGDALAVEYVLMWPFYRTNIREKIILLSDIASLRVQRRWFSTRLILQGHRLAAMADLADFLAEGALEFSIPSRSRADAQRLVACVDERIHPRTSIEMRRQPSPANAQCLGDEGLTSGFYVTSGITGADGLIRLEGDVLTLEYTLVWANQRATGVRKKALPLSDIAAAWLHDGLFFTTLIIQPRHWRAIAGVPGLSPKKGVLKLRIPKVDVANAERIGAELRRRLNVATPELMPESSSSLKTDVGDASESFGQIPRSFLGSVLHYCFDSAAVRKTTTLVRPQSELNFPDARPRASLWRLRATRLGWTLFCLIMYAALWLPYSVLDVFDRPLMPWLAYIDRHYWPYTLSTRSSVSLTPRSSYYDRLALTEERSYRAYGMDNFPTQSPLGNGAFQGMTTFTVTARLEIAGQHTDMEVDGFDRTWRYRLPTSFAARGPVFDVPVVLDWMMLNVRKPLDDQRQIRESLKPDAEALVQIINTSVTHGIMNPCKSIEARPIGRLDTIAHNLAHTVGLDTRTSLSVERNELFPFSRNAGAESGRYEPLFSINWVGIPLSVLIWLIGLRFLSRRRRVVPQP